VRLATSNPSRACSKFHNVRNSSPVQIRSSADRATSPATSHPLTRPRTERPPTPRDAACSAGCGSVRAAKNAGSREESNVVTAGNCVRRKFMHGGNRHLGQPEAEEASQQAEHAAFNNQLPHQAHASRAQSRAHGELLAASNATRSQQVGYIGAGDQQYQRQGEQQSDKNRLYRSGDELLIESRMQFQVARVLRVALTDAVRNGGNLALRLRQGHSRLHLSDKEKKVVAALC